MDQNVLFLLSFLLCKINFETSKLYVAMSLYSFNNCTCWKQWELCSTNLASVISIYLASCYCSLKPAGIRSDYSMHLWP